MARNRVELCGAVLAGVRRRATPAGTPVTAFRLRIEADPAEPLASGCAVPVVCFGASAPEELREGQEVSVVGMLAERRWSGPGGVRKSRLEIVTRTVTIEERERENPS